MSFEDILKVDVGSLAAYPSMMFLWAGSHHETMVTILAFN